MKNSHFVTSSEEEEEEEEMKRAPERENFKKKEKGRKNGGGVDSIPSQNGRKRSHWSRSKIEVDIIPSAVGGATRPFHTGGIVLWVELDVFRHSLRSSSFPSFSFFTSSSILPPFRTEFCAPSVTWSESVCWWQFKSALGASLTLIDSRPRVYIHTRIFVI